MRTPVIVELQPSGQLETAWMENDCAYWWPDSWYKYDNVRVIAQFENAKQQEQAMLACKYADLIDHQFAKDYGWMDREGVMHGCEYAEHTETADVIVDFHGFSSHLWCEDYLLKKGYLRFTPISITFCGKKPSMAQVDSLMKLVQAKCNDKKRTMLDMWAESLAEILKLGVSKR